MAWVCSANIIGKFAFVNKSQQMLAKRFLHVSLHFGFFSDEIYRMLILTFMQGRLRRKRDFWRLFVARVFNGEDGLTLMEIARSDRAMC